MQYTIMISAGNPTEYTRKSGWDTLCDTRAEAEAMAARAQANDGWTVKVVAVSEAEAAHWEESVGTRLARERGEFTRRLRDGSRYR